MKPLPPRRGPALAVWLHGVFRRDTDGGADHHMIETLLQLPYEIDPEDLDASRFMSLWLTPDVGPRHFTCGPAPAMADLARRYMNGAVALGELNECCRAPWGADADDPLPEPPCAFDTWCDDEDERARCVLAEALARAEDRPARPFSDPEIDGVIR